MLNYFISFKTYPLLPERLLWRIEITVAGSYQKTVTAINEMPAHIPDMCRNRTTNATGHNYSYGANGSSANQGLSAGVLLRSHTAVAKPYHETNHPIHTLSLCLKNTPEYFHLYFVYSLHYDAVNSSPNTSKCSVL